MLQRIVNNSIFFLLVNNLIESKLFKNFVIITDKTFLMLLGLMQNFIYRRGCGEINKLSKQIYLTKYQIPSSESAYFMAHMGPGADKAEHCAYMTWFCMACLCRVSFAVFGFLSTFMSCP